MRKLAFILIAALAISGSPAQSQSVNSCRKCLADAAGTLGSDVATGAVLGALGGGVLGGGLPGAVCGAVIGAAGGLASNVKDVLKCQSVCTTEATARNDPNGATCNDMAKKLKKS